jgi:hypothetical protein
MNMYGNHIDLPPNLQNANLSAFSLGRGNLPYCVKSLQRESEFPLSMVRFSVFQCKPHTLHIRQIRQRTAHRLRLAISLTVEGEYSSKVLENLHSLVVSIYAKEIFADFGIDKSILQVQIPS